MERRRGAPDRRQSVVYLTSAPQGAFEERPRQQAILDQRQETFVPYVLPVTVGTTVSFPNNDPFFHNVFSLSKAARFDLGSYASGDSRTQVFLRRGVVKVFCRLHAQMSGLVMVLDHPWYAVPNEAGEFGMPAVPAGDHVLVAWHERIGERRERVRVAAGATAQVTFALPMTEDPR
jgi:plastocyanin